MRYNKIPENTFKELQLNAGILVRKFDPATAAVTRTDIIGATSGGVNFTAVPAYSDFGDDIDNCPKNTKELMVLDEWDIGMSGTYVTISPASAKSMIGAADIDEEDGTKIIPRNDILEEDFEDLWWIGDYSDENGESDGGYVAIHMLNTLSTGGFAIQSGDNAKGQFAFEFKAHYSIEDTEKVPFEVYIKAGGAA